VPVRPHSPSLAFRVGLARPGVAVDYDEVGEPYERQLTVDQSDGFVSGQQMLLAPASLQRLKPNVTAVSALPLMKDPL
jgi:hypothetical protein